MKEAFVTTRRAVLENGVLREELHHIPIRKDSLPWWQHVAGLLLSGWLLFIFGFFDDVEDIPIWVHLFFLGMPFWLSFLVLYTILNDCQPKWHRK